MGVCPDRNPHPLFLLYAFLALVPFTPFFCVVPEPVVCPAQNCDNKTKWELMTEESVFVDFQKIRVQENTNEIPSGSMV